LIDAQVPDLLVLDLFMPKQGGLEVLKVLRSSSATAALPVLVLTALDDEVNTRAGFELGATDYLTKLSILPCSPHRGCWPMKRAGRTDREILPPSTHDEGAIGVTGQDRALVLKYEKESSPGQAVPLVSLGIVEIDRDTLAIWPSKPFNGPGYEREPGQNTCGLPATSRT